MFHSVNGWLLAIFSFGFIIFIHELGHFLAAKRCGIRVEKFSIGFGPKLIGFQRGETEYCISLLPFGGFVKMPGENPEERTGRPDEFSTAPVENRIFVAVAGPVMNFALGVVAFALVYMIAGEVIPKSEETTQIGWVAEDSPAAMAGIRPGDEMITINGKRLHTWTDLRTRVMTHPEKELEIELMRNGQKQKVYITPKTVVRKGIGAIGQIGVSPRQEVEVHQVDDGGWAEAAGLQTGDLIEKINGAMIYTHRDFYLGAKQNHEAEVHLEVKRGEESLEVDLHIDWAVIADIQEESEAAAAGIQSGDEIIAVNGESVLNFDLFSKLSELAQAELDEPIQLELLRNGEKLTAMLTPKAIGEDQIDLGGLDWKVSLSNLEVKGPVRIEKYNIITAWGKGFEKSWETVSQV
ncbi:MAG: RIP metalloprotease RseP, partial [Candidatus Poribacteria bacterium]|nr:RIP metalloprotease RseP [Candidatus Poribacteria bacterium]